MNKGRLEEILSRAKENGISRMAAIGTSSEDWNLYKGLSKQYREIIYYTVGLHPCYVDENFEQEVGKLEIFLKSDNAPIALGEIGLDYFHLPKGLNEIKKIVNLQKIAFAKQLQLAANYKLPVVIHSRNSFSDCMEIIENSEITWEKVLFHCFSEGIEEIKKLNDRGGRASFTGIITFKKNEFLREALKQQGMDKIILETDSPYLAPEPKRGKENEPSYLSFTCESVSSYLNISNQELAEISFCNTCNFYEIDF
jgi:TatD DNase family protein